MAHFLRTLLLLLLFCVCGIRGMATHIVGGNIEMKALEKQPGKYKITLKVYMDETIGLGSSPELLVSIYRKFGDQKIIELRLPRVSQKEVKYDNEACTESRRLKTAFVQYESIVTLDPSKYSDPQGYYIKWTDCCRNNAITNLKTPSVLQTTLVTYFPPLMKDGKPFLDSTPSFNDIDGTYLCVGEPFNMPFEAVDEDGDELRYSMRDPEGFSSTQWENGYSATNAIPGSPALQIDSKTGELFVVPNKLGLFVFSVLVEELRNGVVIGSAARDYQLYVVDCPPATLPDPVAYINGQAATEASLCAGNTLRLTSTVNPNWNYQWKKNGRNIEGANKSTLEVSEKGEYQLYISSISTCSKSGKSQKILVDVTKSTFQLRYDGFPVICENGGQFDLYAPIHGNYGFEWYQDGVLTPVATEVFQAKTQGTYWLVVTDNSDGCKSYSDTVDILKGEIPVAVISTPGNNTSFCPGDSLLITSSDGKPDYHYAWSKDNLPIDGSESQLSVKESGNYTVQITDPAGCLNTSNTIAITLSESVTPYIIPILPLCGTEHAPIQMAGFPSGGTFSGTGVSGDNFDPKIAGVGIHEVKYTVTGSGFCPSVRATETVTVYDLPKVDIAKQVTVQKGGSVYIGNDELNDYLYDWFPSDYLDNPNSPNPLATPPQNQVYKATITDSQGCALEISVIVKLNSHIFVPDIFSPNGDGINETWELKGTDEYPELEVTIYNRWGVAVFFSKGYATPFDGTSQGAILPAGAYVYRITDNKATLSTGSLLLVR